VCSGEGVAEGEVLDLLAHLVDKSLVILEFPGEAGRYRMLETVRQYGLELLEENAETLIWRQRHVSSFLALAEQAEPKLYSPEQSVWFARLEAEHGNLRAALEWLAAQGEAAQGLRLAGALWRFWEVRGHLAEGRMWLSEMLRRAGPDADAAARAKALLGAGGCAYYLRDHGADAYWEESTRLYRTLDDRQGLARVLIYQGWLANDRGEFAASRNFYGEGLALCRAIGDRQGTAWALARLGMLAYWEGDPAGGVSLLEQGLALSREINDQLGRAQWTYLLGAVHHALGALNAAVALYQEALPLCRELDDRRDLGFLLFYLGVGALDRGELANGWEHLKESLSLFLELGDPMGIGTSLMFSSLASLAQSQPARALRLGSATLNLMESNDFVPPRNLQVKFEEAMGAARQMLDAQTADAAWMEGYAMPLEQAIAEMLEV
jgi:tetratricopeptide (TPR) repeat protein